MNRKDQKDHFALTGPLHLTSVANWGDSHYRRSAAACLVNAVYISENDRQNNRTGDKALAPDWWKSFDFECKQYLIDTDSSIFGAVFEFQPWNKNFSCHLLPQHKAPPSYVIAFRGTILEETTACRDISLGSDVILNNRLNRRSRFQIAAQVVITITNITNHQSIWLTGHSLGASIALLVGKHMAKNGTFIQTFVFNPPFPCAKIDKVFKIFIAILLALDGRVAATIKRTTLSKQEQDAFSKLCNWFPYLFLNPNDLICSGYIRYFEQCFKSSRTKCMVEAFGIPSAFVIKNFNPVLSKDFKGAHSITQWWTTSYPNYRHWLYDWNNDK